jgi:nucleoid DNA-binding protein
MSYTDKKIVETYTGLFDGLSVDNKIDLIETLSKSLKKDKKNREKSFYSSFGAFASNKSAERIVKEIRTSRKFRTKDISF